MENRSKHLLNLFAIHEELKAISTQKCDENMHLRRKLQSGCKADV